MPTVYIIAIRIEQDRFLVWSEGPLLDLAVSRGEQLRRASFGGERVQMLPAIFFGGHHQLIVGGPIEDATAGIFSHVRTRTLWRHAAAPDFFCGSCRGVGNPNGPRVRFIRRDEEALRGVAWLGRTPHEGNSFSIQRPNKIAVGIDRRRDELNCLCGYVVDANEAVIAACGNEGQLAAIW